VGREDLTAYLAGGCKPREAWRIGTEHEKFGFRKANPAEGGAGHSGRIAYPDVRALLERLQADYGWEPILEAGNVIGLQQGGQSVTLEPGGQFELSGAPLETLHQTCAEVNEHLRQVKAASQDLGLVFLGQGFDPVSTFEECPIMPKGRYGIMREYMKSKGQLGRDMMFRTCTIQVNLDFDSEADMVKKMRVALALQPVATALFANSPFKEGVPHGRKSLRSHVWTDTDPDRTGPLPFVWEDGFGFDAYAEYALDVPMYFVYRGGEYLNVAGQSFRDFLEGRLPGLPGERPSIKDWEDHISTIFPEVRLKRFLEMRGADGGPWQLICALPALWVGLLYDEQALAEAWALVEGWTAEERQGLQDRVPELALDAPFQGGTVRDLALEVLRISKGGLQRRGHKEAPFLSELENIAQSGVTRADRYLARYHGEWGGSVAPLFRDAIF